MKGMKGGNEIECLSRKSRRLVKLRPAEIRAAKRSFWKRQRREARQAAWIAADADVGNGRIAADTTSLASLRLSCGLPAGAWTS